MTRARDVADTQDNRGGSVSPFVAAKNRIINGDFSVNQRSFTSSTSTGAFTFDRWRTEYGVGTVTYSAQTFTPGAAPATVYESSNFLRIAVSGQGVGGSYALIQQRIEDVRTLANQTVTMSFWARASSGTPTVATMVQQAFGTGGTAGNFFTYAAPQAISTSWNRYSFVIAVPSLTGRTLGTGSFLAANIITSDAQTAQGAQNATIDIWGVQLEAGSVATPFTTATGTIHGEEQACRRYYWRTTGQTYTPSGVGMTQTAGASTFYVNHPVPMRVGPSVLDYANLEVTDLYLYGIAVTNLVIESGSSGTNCTRVTATHAGSATQYKAAFLRNANTSAGYIGFSAEL